MHSVSFAPDSWPGIAQRAPGSGSSPTSRSTTAESGSLLTASSADLRADFHFHFEIDSDSDSDGGHGSFGYDVVDGVDGGDSDADSMWSDGGDVDHRRNGDEMEVEAESERHDLPP